MFPGAVELTSGTCAAVGPRQEQRQRFTAPPVETGATTPYLKVEEGHAQLHTKQHPQSAALPPSISGVGRPLPLITMSRSVTTGGSDSTATHQMAAPPSPARTSDAGEAQLAPAGVLALPGMATEQWKLETMRSITVSAKPKAAAGEPVQGVV